MAQFDPASIPVIGLNSVEAKVVSPYPPTVAAYSIASFGDSRANTGSTGPDLSTAQAINTVRSNAWLCSFLGDAELKWNFGVSGDLASGYASLSRTGGKTLAALAATDAVAVHIQYGVNDALALVAAATIAGNLQALCQEILKMGKIVLFESIEPVNSPTSNFAAGQVIIDATNALMRTWIDLWSVNYPGQMVYMDTASALKLPDGYANISGTLYNTDGTHLYAKGAYVAGKAMAPIARTVLPKRDYTFIGPDNTAPNLLNLNSPSAFVTADTGTISGTAITSGRDIYGYYTELVWTPATLASGICGARLELSVNFQTSAVPAQALVGNEILQGSCNVVIDDGANGAPNAYAVGVRQRFYTGAVFKDWGGIPTPTLTTDFGEVVNQQILTPRMTNATPSVVANPSTGAGYQLQVSAYSQRPGVPVRMRVYNAQLRRVAYGPTPVAVTPPASTVAYTNTTVGNQVVYVAGGTLTVIAVNAVTTGLTSGAFTLNPNDTLTMTYTVAPTSFLVKQS